MAKWSYIKRIYWNIELFEKYMQYLLFQASHWSRSNGWDQFTKTKVSYKLLAKLFCVIMMSYFISIPIGIGEVSLKELNEIWFLLGVAIAGVRLILVGSGNIEHPFARLDRLPCSCEITFSWNVLKHFNASCLKRKSRGQVSQIGQHPPSLRFSGVNG